MDIIETISGEHVIATPLPDAALCQPTDPLALDPLSPIARRPARLAATLAPAGALALDPLGPIIPRPADR
jgi:hypothetical protein